MKRNALVLGGLAAVSVTLAACGSSNDTKSTTSAAAAAPATTTAAATATPAATPSPAAATTDPTITANEYAFAPTDLTVKAGKVKLTLKNSGKIVHEVVVLKTDQAADALKVGSSARVSEKDSVGEVSETAPGATKTSTLDLKPGKYVLVCNIPGHYSLGMRGTLTVK